MTFLKRFFALLFFSFLTLTSVFAANGFVVRQIRVEGLQRVSTQTVLSYLPVRVGQRLTPDETGQIISTLYNTGFFSNVNLSRQGNTLVINVVERPTIGALNISGNKKIPTKKLKEALSNIGIEEGNTLDAATLKALQESMEQQYKSIGYYNAIVTTSVTPQSRNRAAVNIHVNEGGVTTIKEIRITGNHAFSERTLVHKFQMTTWRPWAFLTHSNQFSQDKLNTDLDTLHNFYLDRGYLRFKINSVQTPMSSDNKSINIYVNITEGDVYHVSGYTVSGNLLGDEAQVRKLINLKPGQKFSRQQVMSINAAIGRYYGDQGYAFTNVTPVPTIDDANREVFINFRVDPGQRVYVRRVSFSGNTKTQDIVLRREMRQMEGGVYSISNLEEGKRRLSNLGYLQNVDYKTQPVPGQPDQVDVNYNVTEVSSATASLNVGYSDMYGFLYGANLTESNLLGTGKQVSLGFDNSQYSDMYSLSYVNPYYTESGISRGISIFSQHVTPGNMNGANYTSNVIGAAVTYGMPITEYSGINFGFGYQYIEINEGSSPSQQIADFVNEHGNHFNQAYLTGGWERSTYDRIIFPTHGTRQLITAEVGLPVINNSLDYYKVSYQAAWYQPIVNQFIFNAEADVAYGNGYSSFNELPFFKNYFAGGIDSVRGYEANTLGPLDSLGNPIGGNVLTTGSLALIVPNPLGDKLRTSVFVDGGNVYQNQFALNKLRYSAGIGVEFYIPLIGGPLEFALAEPLNPGKTDQQDHIQFSVGTSF